LKKEKPNHLKLHGKMLLADHSRAIVGSINLAPGSFDSRRELAIEVHAPEVVERLRDIAHHDWKHSHPFDLTDEGLLEELEEHKIDAGEALALDAKHGGKGKKKA
jgi:phosphatidylserine/phosphatidylglycerophosphate/cardiolipin synthase-like enzyme